jgi:NADH-quinone oxidoreductase subunit J
MNAELIIFYILGAFILGSGIFSVTTTRIFRAAIFLLFSLIGIAGLFFLLKLEFLAAVQIIVYVGGIVVLIIFSIFLTQRSGIPMQKPLRSRLLPAVLIVLTGLCITAKLIWENDFGSGSPKAFSLSVAEVGRQMLSMSDYGFVLPFELVSMLLLAAMIGCIVIAMKIKNNDTGSIRQNNE